MVWLNQNLNVMSDQLNNQLGGKSIQEAELYSELAKSPLAEVGNHHLKAAAIHERINTRMNKTQSLERLYFKIAGCVAIVAFLLIQLYRLGRPLEFGITNQIHSVILLIGLGFLLRAVYIESQTLKRLKSKLATLENAEFET